MNDPLWFLVLSAGTEVVELVGAELARAGWHPVGRSIASLTDLDSAFSLDRPQLVVVDEEHHQLVGPVAHIVHAALPNSLVVLLCHPHHESLGPVAIDSGADDYLLPNNLIRLGPLLRRQIRRATPLSPVEICFRELVENTSDAIAFFRVLSSRRFLLEALNPAAAALLHVRPEDVVGKAPDEFLLAGSAEQVQRSLERAFKSEGVFATEQLWPLEAVPRWFHALLVPSLHPGQLPHRIAAVWRDISDRKTFEQTLCDREEMFRRLVETTNVIPWEADLQRRRFSYVGSQVVRRFGYPQSEWYRDNFWIDHIHPDDRDAAHTYQRLADRNTEYEHEYRMLTSTGEVVWVHDLVNVVCPRGQTLLSGFQVDVTARRQAEEAVHQLNSELEKRVAQRTAQLRAANQELEAFSYSVSHDLRAPLRTIDGFSKALEEDYADRLDADGLDMLHRVRAASQRMGDLIDDLLLLSRVTRSEMHRSRVNLSDLARRVAATLSREAPQRQVEWILAPDLYADGDPALLLVLLENLLGNAWKYTSSHERARIEFGRRLLDAEEVFFVKDDGAGFDPAYADKLFQPFQRLHRIDEFEGHGIGLATVARIVARHGGRVWAEGSVDKGATFYFTL